MSEATPEPTPAPAPAPTPEPPAQEPDWKTLARKWETQSKANKAALDELNSKYEAADTERKTLAEQVQTFTQQQERAALVSEIAEANKVPASALRGSTREELEAHAAVLAELIKPSGPVIPGQEKSPEKVGDDPLREFTRNLFQSAKD